jgi:epoxyqueuosine reductase
MSESLENRILALARVTGYPLCGVAPVAPFEAYREVLAGRAARFPSAAGLYRDLEPRCDPRVRTPWAESIVVCIRPYGKYAIPEALGRSIGRNYLCDRRIKACPDNALPARMKEGLKALGLRVRTGGVPSRAAAVRAGLVTLGRNGFAYAGEYGSWINIETWLVDAALRRHDPAADRPAPAPCPADCTACRDACPTGALVEPEPGGTPGCYLHRMDHCVAYLTYGAPFPVAPDLWARMGEWIYGCDACQAACPLNRGCWRATEPAPWLEAVAGQLTPEALAAMDARTYREVVHPLFGYIPEEDLARWRANARRARDAGVRVCDGV